MTQPALSYHVAKVERELDTVLFERLARGVRITDAGRAMLEPARSTLAEAARAVSAVQAVRGLLSGRLRIALIRTATDRVSRIVAEFHRRYPDVVIEILDPADDADVAEHVRSARADVGIMHVRASSEGLCSIVIGTQELVPCCRPR